MEKGSSTHCSCQAAPHCRRQGTRYERRSSRKLCTPHRQHSSHLHLFISSGALTASAHDNNSRRHLSYFNEVQRNREERGKSRMSVREKGGAASGRSVAAVQVAVDRASAVLEKMPSVDFQCGRPGGEMGVSEAGRAKDRTRQYSTVLEGRGGYLNDPLSCGM